MENLCKYDQNAYVSTLPENVQNEIIDHVKNMAQELFYTEDETNEAIQDS